MNEGEKVTTFELFFDVLFVFAITQVVGLMARDAGGLGVLHGMLVLAVLWWCWSGYAWLGNTVHADEGPVRLVLFPIMFFIFVAGLAVPEAFEDRPGGLPGPLVFAFAYLIVRLGHLLVYWLVSGDDPGLRRQLVRGLVPMLGGTGLVVVAAFFSGTAQIQVWALALLVDYGGVMLQSLRNTGWRVRSASHFAERHALVLIVALGESFLAIGAGVADRPMSWTIVVGAACGVAIASALWWVYFDVVALVAERTLARARGVHRARIARDSYTYLHFPMVAGIVLTALGMKKVLGYMAEGKAAEPLHGIPLYALYGGVALYMLAHIGFRLRNLNGVSWPKVGTVLALGISVPVAGSLPAWAALVLLTAICLTQVCVQVAWYAEARAKIRADRHRVRTIANRIHTAAAEP